MKLIWSKRAADDLELIGDFISRHAPERARSHVQVLIDRAKQAAHLPRSGCIVPEFQDDTLREIIEGNYRIAYEICSAKKTVVVLTVFEGHKLIGRLFEARP